MKASAIGDSDSIGVSQTDGRINIRHSTVEGTTFGMRVRRRDEINVSAKISHSSITGGVDGGATGSIYTCIFSDNGEGGALNSDCTYP